MLRTNCANGKFRKRAIVSALLCSAASILSVGAASAQLVSSDQMGLPSVAEVISLSADGRMAIMISSANGAAYHWDGVRYVQLPTLGGRAYGAYGLSGRGDVVVGESGNAAGYRRAYRWSANEGIVDIGALVEGENASSRANGVSYDGNVIVGQSGTTNSAIFRGFAWIRDSDQGLSHNPEMYELSPTSGFNNSMANAVSSDGRYAAGQSYGQGADSTVTRWGLYDLAATSNAHIEDLGTLGGTRGSGLAISEDGKVVVGSSRNADEQTRAFRWVEGATGGVATNVQMYDLGLLSDGHTSSYASGVSADGSVVVGTSWGDDISEAFRWEEDDGMISVADWLAAHGVDVGDNNLRSASSVSADGEVVAGGMRNANGESRGYIARADIRGGGLMDVEEYQSTLYSAAGIANAGEFMSWLPMNGAHHRPLMLTPNLNGDMCAWATGDFAQHSPSSTGMALAEIGACTDLAGGSVRIGGSVGATSSWQDLALGGAARMQGQYVLSEIDWQPDGTPLLLSLTGMLGSYQAQIDRAYSNGAATAMSKGGTDAFGGVVRVRADWLEAAVLGNTSINPYASVGFGGLHVNGYTESGGPFPAVFNAQSLGHADIRLGVTAITEFSASTQLSTTLEVAHRTGTAAAATGNVPGVFNFALGGGTYAQTWVRAGLELDHKVSDNLSLSTSLHVASTGRDPSLSASFGLKGGF